MLHFISIFVNMFKFSAILNLCHILLYTSCIWHLKINNSSILLSISRDKCCKSVEIVEEISRKILHIFLSSQFVINFTACHVRLMMNWLGRNITSFIKFHQLLQRIRNILATCAFQKIYCEKFQTLSDSSYPPARAFLGVNWY